MSASQGSVAAVPAGRLSRWRRVGFTALTGVVALTVLAVAAEWLCRRSAATERPWTEPAPRDRRGDGWARSHVPGLSFRYRPDAEQRAGEGVNAWGYRGDDFAVPKPEGRLRIVVVGDSMAFGRAVPADRTFPAQLESGLRDDGARSEVEVLNLGTHAYSGVQVAAVVHHIVRPLLEPDLLIYAFYANDVADTVLLHFQHTELPGVCLRDDTPPDPGEASRRNPLDWLRTTLRLRSAAFSELRYRASVLRYEVLLPHIGRDLSDEMLRRERALLPYLVRHRSTCADYGVLAESLRSMGSDARAMGIPLVVFRVPILGRMGGEPDPKVAFLRAMATAIPGLSLYDPEAALLEAMARDGLERVDLVAAPWEHHPSETGHRLLAEALRGHLLRAGHLRDDAPRASGGR